MDDHGTPGMDEPISFAAELARWRDRRGWSKKALAETMGFDPSYISHIEHGRHDASEDFARRAEAVLSAGGSLSRAWQASADSARSAPAPATGPAAGLVVEHDDAELRYADGMFTARMRRRLINAGSEPVTRYLIRISVDRYPGEPERSNALYRAHPLSWEELGLAAHCDGEPMTWRPKHDRDSFKEVWLCFENPRSRFPLYPGEHVTLDYAYTISADKWGPWFQRAVRLPTRHLSVRVLLPAELNPAVWGTETSATAEAVPLRTPIQRQHDGGAEVFSWATDEPPMGARYRLEWRFRAERDEQPRPPLRTASDRMTAAGIVQAPDPALETECSPFHLPAEKETAREVTDQLFAAMGRVSEHHVFGKGMGLAAPQIGTTRATAIIQPPDDEAEPIVLFNPQVVAASSDTDEQYEGCLSFFDVRGKVQRPLRLEVEHTTLDGRQVITAFEQGIARLVAHEIDHLSGQLYTDHMPDDVHTIPVEEYRGAGQSWTHSR